MSDAASSPPSTSRRENLSYLIPFLSTPHEHRRPRSQGNRPLGPMVRPQVRARNPFSRLLTHGQTLLPPRRTTSPPRPHVRLWRQGMSHHPPPRHPSSRSSRIAGPLLPLPSPRWSSAERTTRLSMSSGSIPSPPRPLTLNAHSELDSSFFLVTVDLWSADGKREMNLVLHPSSSTDRYVSTMAAKPKKSRGIPSAASPRTDHPSPSSSHSTPNSAPEPPRPSLDLQVSMPSLARQIIVKPPVSQP